ASAGPPMRIEVKGANGRANSLRPGTSRSRVGRSHRVERDDAISHSPCGVYKCLANLPDIPGTEGQEDVVGAHIALQEGHDRCPLLQVVHLTLAMADQALIEQRRGHPGQWRFASGINIEQYQRISVVKGSAELLLQQVRARVAVGLKDNDQARFGPDRF